jgi:hypothetical protein
MCRTKETVYGDCGHIVKSETFVCKKFCNAPSAQYLTPKECPFKSHTWKSSKVGGKKLAKLANKRRKIADSADCPTCTDEETAQEGQIPNDDQFLKDLGT